ncbi:MAG: CoA ester lyase [Marinovum sp.]|nr:CoA ester lyase [Marinovum sp.]
MRHITQPLRSVLYIPASKERVLERAKSLPADALIFDLEDAVTPDAKDAARALLARQLPQGGYGKRLKLLRVNGLDTPWGESDIAALQAAGADAILLPKVNSAADIEAAAALIEGDIPLWAMIETARGVLNAAEIADHPRLQGMVAGTNDLAKELGCAAGNDRAALQFGLQAMVMAARAAGCAVIDGVYNRFKDQDGLSAECMQGKALGFDGKTLIHPAQIEVTNQVFAPSNGELDLARRQIAAFEEIQRVGQGVAVVDGNIVENLHADRAKQLLYKANLIAELTMG